MEEKTAVQALSEALPGAVLEAGESFGDPVVRLRPEALPEAVRILRAAPWAFRLLLDLTCVDYPGRAERFELVYHLYSLAANRRIRLKLALAEGAPEADSLAALWKNAAWLEREVFDMFGVRFRGHPDLRRLLLYDGFEGHPLRKDYPFRKRQPRLPERS